MAENKQSSQANMKSTVRKRKRNPKANTQRYLPFAEIRNDTVVMKSGGMRAVLQVEPVNFNLKSETEQQGIIAGYEAFLNTLAFPVQIVVRSTKVNIDPYLAKINEKAKNQENEQLKDQTLAYGKFVKKIVEIADIMQKRFYVVVPLDDAPRKQSPLSRFLMWMNIDDSPGKLSQRTKHFNSQVNRLKERVDLVEAGLRNIGIMPKRMNTLQILKLYYGIYNRGQAQSQKFPEEELNTATDRL